MTKMKALSLTQPWATAICLGLKQYETRSWATGFRGELCIHAAKGFPKDAREFLEEQQQEGRLPYDELPLGKIVAVCTMTACLKTRDVWPTIGEIERDFGDYGCDRYAFRLEKVRVLGQPIAARGALSFWAVGEEDSQAVRHQLQQLEEFEERAGIKEFCANMPRKQAEEEAFLEIYGEMEI